jgi:hypothetical protein
VQRFSPKKTKSPAKKQDFVEKMGLTSTPLHFARHKLLALNKYYKGCEKQPVLVEKMGLEPTTSWLPAKRSSHLSYIPM